MQKFDCSSDLPYFYFQPGSTDIKMGKRKSRIEDDEDEEEKTNIVKIPPPFPQGIYTIRGLWRTLPFI